MCICETRYRTRPAVLEAGPHQLLQSPDLSRRRLAAQGLGDPALLPEGRGLPRAWSLGKYRDALSIFPPGVEVTQDLSHAAGRRYVGAAAKGEPSHRGSYGIPSGKSGEPHRMGGAERS